MTTAKVIHMHTSDRCKSLRQVRVWTASRALEIELAVNNAADAKEMISEAKDDRERYVLLEIYASRLEALVATVMR